MVRMCREGNPSALLVGMQTGAATVENSRENLDSCCLEKFIISYLEGPWSRLWSSSYIIQRRL